MQTTIRALLGATLIVGLFGIAVAKLPPPPPMTDEQKAEKAAKDKAAAEHTKAVQIKAEDRVVARYIAEMKAKGVTVTPQLPPGAAQPDAAKSLPPQPEKAGAHSPPKK